MEWQPAASFKPHCKRLDRKVKSSTDSCLGIDRKVKPTGTPTPKQADKHDNLSLATRTQQAEKHHMPCCPTARWPGPTGTCLFILSPIHSSRCLMIHSIFRSVIQSVIVTVIHWTKASRRMSTQRSPELVGECQRREELRRALVIHWIMHSIIHHTCDGTPTGHQRDTNGTPGSPFCPG